MAAFGRLKDDGVPTDITVDHQVAHSVYMFDPDGNYASSIATPSRTGARY